MSRGKCTMIGTIAPFGECGEIVVHFTQLEMGGIGSIAIITQYPLAITDTFEYARSFYGFRCLLNRSRRCTPLTSSCSTICCRQTTTRYVTNTTSTLILVKTMVKTIFIIIRNG